MKQLNQGFLLVKLKSSWLGWMLWNICVTNDYGYVPIVLSTSWSFPHSWLITRFGTRLTWRVPLVEQEMLTLPEHLSSPSVLSGVRVTQSLVLCVCFVDRCLSFCPFAFGHCVVCSSSIDGFWLPLWYLQTLLTQIEEKEQILLLLVLFLQSLLVIKGKKQIKKDVNSILVIFLQTSENWIKMHNYDIIKYIEIYLYLDKFVLPKNCFYK